MEQTRAQRSAEIVFLFYPSYYYKPQISLPKSIHIVIMIEFLWETHHFPTIVTS